MVNPIGHWIWILFGTRFRISLRGLSRFQGIGFQIPLRRLYGFRVTPVLVVPALPYYYPNPSYTMNKGEPYHVRLKIGYFSRENDENRCHRKTRCYFSTWSDKKNFITDMGFPGFIQKGVLASWNINIVWNKDSFYWCVCLPYIIWFTCWTHFCACFLPVLFITPCSNPYVFSAWNIDPVFFLLFECMWWHTCQTYKIYWPSSCLLQGFKYGHDIMQKQ